MKCYMTLRMKIIMAVYSMMDGKDFSGPAPTVSGMEPRASNV